MPHRNSNALSYLIAYANAKQWALATGGLTIAFSGGPTVEFHTEDVSLALINGKVARLSQPNPPATLKWQVDATNFVVLTGAQLIAAGAMVADLIQATRFSMPS